MVNPDPYPRYFILKYSILPYRTLVATCRYAYLLPAFVCMPPLYLPAASMLACCQYACLLPICLPTANTPACCLYGCLLPICLPTANTLAYCQYACLMPLCLPTANMPACCLNACLLPICLPAYMSAATFKSIFRPYASCYGLQSAFTSACLPTFKSICLLVCTFYQTTVHTSMSLSTGTAFRLSDYLSACLNVTLLVCISSGLRLSLCLSMRFSDILYVTGTVPICTSLSACK